MIISDDRQKHFAHLIIDGLWGDMIIDFDEELEDQVIRFTKQIIGQWVEEQGDIDASVRKTIGNLKRDVYEGTPEWNVLYKKYYAEELAKRGSR